MCSSSASLCSKNCRRASRVTMRMCIRSATCRMPMSVLAVVMGVLGMVVSVLRVIVRDLSVSMCILGMVVCVLGMIVCILDMVVRSQFRYD